MTNIKNVGKQTVGCLILCLVMVHCSSKPKAPAGDAGGATAGTPPLSSSSSVVEENNQPTLAKKETTTDTQVDVAFELSNVDSPEQYTIFALSSTEAMAEDDMASMDWSAAEQGASGMIVSLSRGEEELNYFVYAKVQPKDGQEALITEQYEIKVPALESVALSEETFEVLSGTEILCAFSKDAMNAVVVYDQAGQGIQINYSNDALKTWQVSKVLTAAKESFLNCSMGVSGEDLIVISPQNMQTEKPFSNQYLAMNTGEKTDQTLHAQPLINSEELFKSVADQQELQNVVFSGSNVFLTMSCEKENKIIRIEGFHGQKDGEPFKSNFNTEVLVLENIPQIKTAYPRSEGKTADDFFYVTKDNAFYLGYEEQQIEWDKEHHHLINLFLSSNMAPALMLYDAKNKNMVHYGDYKDDDETIPLVWKPYVEYTFKEDQNTISVFALNTPKLSYMLVSNTFVKIINLKPKKNTLNLQAKKITQITFKKPVVDDQNSDAAEKDETSTEEK